MTARKVTAGKTRRGEFGGREFSGGSKLGPFEHNPLFIQSLFDIGSQDVTRAGMITDPAKVGEPQLSLAASGYFYFFPPVMLNPVARSAKPPGRRLGPPTLQQREGRPWNDPFRLPKICFLSPPLHPPGHGWTTLLCLCSFI